MHKPRRRASVWVLIALGFLCVLSASRISDLPRTGDAWFSPEDMRRGAIEVALLLGGLILLCVGVKRM